MDGWVAPLEDPRSQGKNLVGPKLGSYWRYRVGDVRVILDIRDEVVTVLGVEIAHCRKANR